MSKRRKSSVSSNGGANWMDTYGDMVTLLLTFFVMLYASSSFDKDKWEYIVKAFESWSGKENSQADFGNLDSVDVQEVIPPSTPQDLKEGEMPQNFDQLYQYLTQYVKNNNLSGSVEVQKGKANIYIKFRDNIFFGGDSAVLLDSGKNILVSLSQGMKAVDDKILAVKVCGHTAEGRYSVVDDTELSAGRAVNVVNFLESINAVTPAKLISAGYGKSRPIAPNDTEANRAKNRRVEILIVRNDADYTDPEVIQEMLKEEYGLGYTSSDSSTVK